MSEQYNHSSARVNNHSSLIRNSYGYIVQFMKYGERLRAARIHADLTQAQLADKSKNLCSQENISKLERGDATGSEFTVQLADACRVNPLWLATGDGEMLSHQVSEPVQQVTRRMQTLSEREQYRVAKMIDLYLEPAENDTQQAEPNQGQQ